MPTPPATNRKAAADSNEKKDDSDIEWIDVDPDAEEPEQKTLFTEDFFQSHKYLKEQAEKFFDPSSNTNVVNIPKAMRMEMANYATAMFEWICCLPTVDILVELSGFPDLPFPVTPDQKRILIKREYGARLSDMWKQTKDTEKMANQLKLNKNVALLTLLNYAFANSNYEMDVFPLLKAYGISREDYKMVAEFVFSNSCPKEDWEEPVELIQETKIHPIDVSVALYLMKSECAAGKLAIIAWEKLERDLTAVPIEFLQKFEQPLLEGFKQLRNSPEAKANRKKEEEMKQKLRNATKDLLDMKSEMKSVTQQIAIRRNELADLRRMFVEVLAMTRPDDVDETGVDEDIICLKSFTPFDGSPRLSSFKGQLTLKQQDFVVEPDMVVLARSKDDAPEKFRKATVMSQKENGNWEVGFSDDSIATIPLSSLAEYQPMKGKAPICSEGVRVIARVRHPCLPNEAPGLYSGTIISRYDLHTEEYAVAFDDSFEEYVGINEIHLMMAQPFNEHEIWDRSYAHHLMTSNDKAPGPSEERRLFLLMFFGTYPEWNMVKMNEKVGKNIAVQHRNGEGWVAKVLKVDRHMIWLRFSPKEAGLNSMHGCLHFPCKKHDHLDEKMYRGNPRLKQVSAMCDFDKALEIYRSANFEVVMNMHSYIIKELENRKNARIRQQHHQRRLHAASGTSFEPAIPNESKLHGGKRQTARKCGVGLLVEPEVPEENKIKKIKLEPRIEYHKVASKLEERGNDIYHAVCTPECLKGMDAEPIGHRFMNPEISPFYVPILCGWRRNKQECTSSGAKSPKGTVYYRAPCGHPLHMMSEIVDYLEVTGAQLNVDFFTFSFEVDETRYVPIEKWSVVMEDVTNGLEVRPIPVINDHDDKEPVPTFIYCARRFPQRPEVDMSTDFCSGCDCTDNCRDWTKCACQRLTHRESVRAEASHDNITKGYSNRLLEERVRTGIFECNEKCGCDRKKCSNRVVQKELKVPMHMVRTPAMGWGVRTAVDIPKGTFIACYHGAVLSDAIAETNKNGDEYYADLDFYNLAEQEKTNSGVDYLLDQGVFFDDVGARDLTEEEKEKADREDRLVKWRREEEEKKKKRGRRKNMEKMLDEVKKEEEEEEEEEEDEEEQSRGRRDMEKKLKDVKVEEEDEEEGERRKDVEKRLKDVKVEEEDDYEEGEERQGENENEEGGGEEMDGEEEEDENADDGFDGYEGDTVEDEENEEAKKEEERRKEEERKEVEKKNVAAMERRKRLHEESKERFSIPINDPDKLQFEAYFENADCENLYLIDAKDAGNIGRQFNHSCNPNMFTQHVFVDTHDIRLPWVAFFAIRDIKAGEELSWDYGWSINEKNPRGLKCQCGEENCRIDLL